MNIGEFVTSMCHEFELAYLATGLQPIRREWGNGRDTACMLVALNTEIYGPPQQSKSPFFGISLERHEDVQLARYFQGKYPQFPDHIWPVLLRYALTGFDGVTTFPSRWLKRNWLCDVKTASPKLLGSAIGSLVKKAVFSAPIPEKGINSSHIKKESGNWEESAAWELADCLVGV